MLRHVVWVKQTKNILKLTAVLFLNKSRQVFVFISTLGTGISPLNQHFGNIKIDSIHTITFCSITGPWENTSSYSHTRYFCCSFTLSVSSRDLVVYILSLLYIEKQKPIQDSWWMDRLL